MWITYLKVECLVKRGSLFIIMRQKPFTQRPIEVRPIELSQSPFHFHRVRGLLMVTCRTSLVSLVGSSNAKYMRLHVNAGSGAPFSELYTGDRQRGQAISTMQKSETNKFRNKLAAATNSELGGPGNRWYILPIGGLYATYHLLREPKTTIEQNARLLRIISKVRIAIATHEC